jgi:hypothetical protein
VRGSRATSTNIERLCVCLAARVNKIHLSFGAARARAGNARDERSTKNNERKKRSRELFVRAMQGAHQRTE